MKHSAIAAALSLAFAANAWAQSPPNGTYQFVTGPGTGYGTPPFTVTGGSLIGGGLGGFAGGIHVPNCAGFHVHGVFATHADPASGGCGHGIIGLIGGGAGSVPGAGFLANLLSSSAANQLALTRPGFSPYGFSPEQERMDLLALQQERGRQEARNFSLPRTNVPTFYNMVVSVINPIPAGGAKPAGVGSIIDSLDEPTLQQRVTFGNSGPPKSAAVTAAERRAADAAAAAEAAAKEAAAAEAAGREAQKRRNDLVDSYARAKGSVKGTIGRQIDAHEAASSAEFTRSRRAAADAEAKTSAAADAAAEAKATALDETNPLAAAATRAARTAEKAEAEAALRDMYANIADAYYEGDVKGAYEGMMVQARANVATFQVEALAARARAGLGGSAAEAAAAEAKAAAGRKGLADFEQEAVNAILDSEGSAAALEATRQRARTARANAQRATADAQAAAAAEKLGNAVSASTNAAAGPPRIAN